VHTQAAGWRNQIDEPPEWCPTGERKMDASAEIGGRDCFSRHPVDGAGDGRCIKPCGVDDAVTADGRRLLPADNELEAFIAYPTRQHRSPEHDHCTRGLRFALKGEHQCVTVDESGRGREQGGDATLVRAVAPVGR
jgi:hypothetical protein